jgi:hypothetical protein
MNAQLRKELLAISVFARSLDWAKTRRLFLKQHPTCAVCGTRRGVEAHHIRPYYLYPELELDFNNLITLCENGANHHLFVGHLMSFKSYNTDVKQDAEEWNQRIKSRPKWKEMV